MVRTRRSEHLGGFTLIEMVMAIVVVALLLGLLLPALQGARDAARSAECASNLRHMGVLLETYVQENRGLLPPRVGSADELSLGWQAAMAAAPVGGRDARAYAILLPQPQSHPAARWVAALSGLRQRDATTTAQAGDDLAALPGFTCPSDMNPSGPPADADRFLWPDATPRSYLYNGWNDGLSVRPAGWSPRVSYIVPRRAVESPSETIALGEKKSGPQHVAFHLDYWAHPGDPMRDAEQARHRGGVSHYGYTDGSARPSRPWETLLPENQWAVRRDVRTWTDLERYRPRVDLERR